MDESPTTLEFPTIAEAESFCSSVVDDGEGERLQVGSVRLNITGLSGPELENWATRHNGKVLSSSIS
jgi:hypothetical protein